VERDVGHRRESTRLRPGMRNFVSGHLVPALLGDATRSVQNCTLRAPRQFRLPKTFRVMSVAGAKTGPFDDSGRGVLTQPDLPANQSVALFDPRESDFGLRRPRRLPRAFAAAMR
jgi:hypothetical protein